MKFSLTLLLVAPETSYYSLPRPSCLTKRTAKLVWRRTRLSSPKVQLRFAPCATHPVYLLQPNSTLSSTVRLLTLNNKGYVFIHKPSTLQVLTSQTSFHYFMYAFSLLQVYSFAPTLLTLNHFTFSRDVNLLNLLNAKLTPRKFQHLTASRLTTHSLSMLHLL